METTGRSTESRSNSIPSLINTDVNSEEGRYCPACHADWRAGRIPQEHIDQGLYGPPTTEPRYFSRLIGVEVQGVYDGVLYWRCPDCNTEWDRFSGRPEIPIRRPQATGEV